MYVPDHLSTIGLSILNEKVKKIGQYIDSAKTFSGDGDNPLKIASLGGVIFVKVRIGGQRITVTHANKMYDVSQLLGDTSCFSTYTTEMIGYSAAAENSVPVWMLETTNAVRAASKKEYEKITEEFLNRF